MILSQIAAISENFALGKDNQLLWHHPEDLKYFKEKTVGKIMIMGRKTFDSLGKPLPKRFHIVITRQRLQPSHPSVVYVQDVAGAIEIAKKLTEEKQYPNEVMVVGGAEIYRQTLDDCDFLYLTRIPGQFAADAYYPSQFETHFGLSTTKVGEADPLLHYEVWAKRQTFSRK